MKPLGCAHSFNSGPTTKNMMTAKTINDAMNNHFLNVGFMGNKLPQLFKLVGINL